MNLYRVTLSVLLFAELLSQQGSSYAQSAYGSGRSQWAYLDPAGKLAYKALPGGDKIMDFSHAGYMGGGVSIPSPAVKITLSPAPGDNSEAIQNAINKVSEMKLINGFRGTVLLKPGTYNCEKAVTINASGVILRGSGSGENGSTLNMTGKAHTCVVVRGAVSSKEIGTATSFSDSYVPAGTKAFNVTEVSGLAAGDTIRIIRPITAAWVKLMGMDTLVRDGKKQTWMTGDITTDRIIKKISGKNITLDVPLTDNYDAKYLGASGVSVTKINSSGWLSQIGIENFRIVSRSNRLPFLKAVTRPLR